MVVRPRPRSHSADQRIAWLGVGVVVGVLVLAGRTLLLPALPAVAGTSSTGPQPIRGTIEIGSQIRPGTTVPLAANASRFLVAADPKKINDPLGTGTVLAEALNLDRDTVVEKLSNKRTSHAVLIHGVDEKVKKQIEALDRAGVTVESETVRQYPLGVLAGHVTGFLGFSGDVRVGQYGLEATYDKVLRGHAGPTEATVVDGADVLTTLDRELQDFACTKLKDAVAKHGATGGSVVVVNPDTGAVLALCGEPSFDPNAYGDVQDPATFLDPATMVGYEPGSVFKPITMAGALDTGSLSPDTTYEDTGSVQIGKFTIRNSDSKAHGIQTMRQVLEESLNTGAIFAARTQGASQFQQIVHKFGFGKKTGVDLPAEASGNLGKLDSAKDIYVATASYGQGITVTPLQLAMAYAAIANGGKLMQPYLVDAVVARDGTVHRTEPRTVRTVIQPATATQLTAMLAGVVERGHGKRAGVPGYFIAGKTGTAQIPYRDQAGYEPGVTIGTFAGFGPVENPKFAMVVKIDRPQDVQFAESSAAPLFGDIAAFLLRAYGVAPTRPVVP